MGINKRFFFLLFSLWITIPVFAQSEKEIEQKLLSEYHRLFEEGVLNDEYYEERIAFKDFFIQEINKSSHILDYSLAQLSKKIRIVSSSDGKFRTYGWNDQSGGTWLSLVAIAQYKTRSGEPKAKQLNTGDEARLGTYTDAIIYEIYQVLIENRTHYLTLAWGKHGGGHQHSIARVFSIEHNELVLCETCLGGNKEIVVEERFHPIVLEYNKQSKTLVFETHIAFGDERDMLEYDGEQPRQKVYFKLTNQGFILKD